MFQMTKQFVNSAKELKKLKTIVITGLLIAIGIVLGQFSIQISQSTKIGISFIATQLTAMLFGPVVGAIFGGIMDVLKFLMKPDGGFFFGYTLTAIISGFIYGLFYYKLKIKKPLKTDVTGIDLVIEWFLANIQSILLIFIANVLIKVLCILSLSISLISLLKK